jgi:hypothetical protein
MPERRTSAWTSPIVALVAEGGFLFAWREVRRELLARLRGRSSTRDRANVAGANHVRCERTFVELRDEFRARRPNDEQGQGEQSDPRRLRARMSAPTRAQMT